MSTLQIVSMSLSGIMDQENDFKNNIWNVVYHMGVRRFGPRGRALLRNFPALFPVRIEKGSDFSPIINKLK